jgi:hypothetical protein
VYGTKLPNSGSQVVAKLEKINDRIKGTFYLIRSPFEGSTIAHVNHNGLFDICVSIGHVVQMNNQPLIKTGVFVGEIELGRQMLDSFVPYFEMYVRDGPTWVYSWPKSDELKSTLSVGRCSTKILKVIDKVVPIVGISRMIVIAVVIGVPFESHESL